MLEREEENMKKVLAIIGVIVLLAFVGALLPEDSASDESSGSTVSAEKQEEQVNDEKENQAETQQEVLEEPQETEQPEQNEQTSEVGSDTQETQETTDDKSNNISSQSAPQNVTSNDSASVIVPNQEDTTGNLVWVPVNGGTKYHSKASCSNMKEPKQITIEHAESNGYTACKRCY